MGENKTNFKELFLQQPDKIEKGDIDTINPYDAVWDESIYPRRQVDDNRVKKYERLMKDGHDFPPIVLEKGTQRLLDGKARVTAAKNLDRDIEYYEFDTSDYDPTLISAWFNSTHGEPLGRDEKKGLVQKAVQEGLYDVEKLSALLAVPSSNVSSWVRDMKRAKQQEELDKAREMLEDGDQVSTVVSETDLSVDDVESVKDEMLTKAKNDDSEEEDKDYSSRDVESEWGEQSEEEPEDEKSSDRIECPYCGSSTFRVEDVGGTAKIKIEDGEGDAIGYEEDSIDDGYYVTCLTCGETLETERRGSDVVEGSLYDAILDNTEEMNRPGETADEETNSGEQDFMEKVEEDISDEEEEAETKEPSQERDDTPDTVDDKTIFARYNRSPMGTDYWTSGEEASLNLLYHYSKPGDMVLELFDSQNMLMDFGDEMGRNVVAYNVDPDRDDVREWNPQEFYEAVKKSSLDYSLAYIDRRFIKDTTVMKLLSIIEGAVDKIAIFSDLEFNDMCQMKGKLGNDFEIEKRIMVVENNYREPDFRGDVEQGYYRELFMINT